MAKMWARNLSTLPFMGKTIGMLNAWLQSTTGVKLVTADEFPVSPRWIQRLIYFEKLLGLVHDVPGDIVECGVGWGKSLDILALLARAGGETRHIWGFDSFAGLPKPSPEDFGERAIYAKQRMFSEATEAAVHHNLRSAGMDEDFISNHITIVKGWFSDTLPKYAGTSIALLHIDADLYESYQVALEHLWPKVAYGGIVAFDEYQWPGLWPGARKAVDEYFEQRPGVMTMQSFPFYDRYYVIKHG